MSGISSLLGPFRVDRGEIERHLRLYHVEDNPEMNDFIRQVRAFTPDDGGRTPAAALTAFARAEDRTRVLRAGYQAHVAKPVEPAELAAVVASLATRR